MKTINIRLIIVAAMTMMMLYAGVAMANPVLDLGSASGNPGTQVTLPITLTNDPQIQVAGVSMDIGYDSTYLTPINATIGPAGEAAGKDVSKNIVSPGLFRIGVFSVSDLSPIGNGIVANVTFEISSNAPADTYVLTNTPSSATPAGVDVATDGSDGSIQVAGAVTSTIPAGTTTSTIPAGTTTSTIPVGTTTSTIPAGTTTTTTSVQPTTTTTSVRPTTTTTAVQPTTTTVPATTSVPPKSHIGICLSCHDVNDLHAQAAHGNCSQCHDGAPDNGNVSAEECIKCHPLSAPDKCSLVTLNSHGSSCISCHVKCADGITTTTTTTPLYMLSVYPGSVKTSWFFPRPLVKLIISGTNVNFDEPTKVEIEGAPPMRMIEHVSSAVLIVRAWIPPKVLIGKGVKRVTVQSGGQTYISSLEIQ